MKHCDLNGHAKAGSMFGVCKELLDFPKYMYPLKKKMYFLSFPGARRAKVVEVATAREFTSRTEAS